MLHEKAPDKSKNVSLFLFIFYIFKYLNITKKDISFSFIYFFFIIIGTQLGPTLESNSISEIGISLLRLAVTGTKVPHPLEGHVHMVATHYLTGVPSLAVKWLGESHVLWPLVSSLSLSDGHNKT